MTTKIARKIDNAQHQRFIEMAREVGVDETEGAFDRAFDKIAPAKSAQSSKVSRKPARIKKTAR